MEEQIGWRGFARMLRHEAPFWAQLLPQLPRLLHRALAADRVERIEDLLGKLLVLERRRNRMIGVAVALLALALILAVALRFW
jgi:ubiquinone biosynthesis protein